MAAGIRATEFWSLTPYLTRQAIEAAHDEEITRLWMAATMVRAKKLPALDELLKKDTQAASKDMQARMKSALLGLNARRHA